MVGFGGLSDNDKTTVITSCLSRMLALHEEKPTEHSLLKWYSEEEHFFADAFKEELAKFHAVYTGAGVPALFKALTKFLDDKPTNPMSLKFKAAMDKEKTADIFLLSAAPEAMDASEGGSRSESYRLTAAKLALKFARSLFFPLFFFFRTRS